MFIIENAKVYMWNSICRFLFHLCVVIIIICSMHFCIIVMQWFSIGWILSKYYCYNLSYSWVQCTFYVLNLRRAIYFQITWQFCFKVYLIFIINPSFLKHNARQLHCCAHLAPKLYYRMWRFKFFLPNCFPYFTPFPIHK